MITSKIKESKDVEEQTFPRLMKFDGSNISIVVLFNEFGCGTVVHVEKSAYHRVGQWDDCWAMASFKPFKGTIELAQE